MGMTSVRPLRLLLPFCLLACTFGPTVAVGQAGPPPVDVVSDAELVFEQAIDAFEQGDYGMAYRRFRLVYSGYPLNQKTTAARLMAGKSLYRDGRLQDAIELLTEFVQDYPTSSYVAEAERTIRIARSQLESEASQPEVFILGIALPMSEGDQSLAQAMFNGIRLAVNEHNDRFGDQWPVRMVFRDSRGTAGGGASAASELVEEGASAIVGPLYSEEADAAANVANRASTVMIAPLATEEFVSQGRSFVFQANPTWTIRGQMLARFAVDRFGHNRYAIFAELGDSYSERMAEGFQEELIRAGKQVLHYRLVAQGSDWYNLGRILPPASWDSLEGVYLPISGEDAGQFASAALSSLSGSAVQVQVFGNSEWGNLAALSLASDYNTVYTTSFHLLTGDAAVQRFDEAYRELSGIRPEGETGRLAYAGYDVTRFLLTRLTQSGDASLAESIANAPWYQGLGSRLFFEGGNVNRGLFYMRYRPGKVDLLR